MYVALQGCYRAKWTAEIHDEWKRNLLINRPDLTRANLDRISDAMDRAVPDSVVSGHEELIGCLDLPDPDDRHVLAAAIRCGASVIVTMNLKDFPPKSLKKYGIEAQHPDEFLLDIMDLHMGSVVAAAQQQRKSMKAPPMAAKEFLDMLEKQGLVKTCKKLEEFQLVI